MYTLRKRFALPGRARTLLPALAFVGAAMLAAVGGEAIAALCLLPAGLALEAGRWQPDAERSQPEAAGAVQHEHRA